MRKEGRREVNQQEETEQGAARAERQQDKGGTGKRGKKRERQEEGGRERKKEQENGAGQKGEKQGRDGATGARAAAGTVPGSPPWVPPPSPVHWCERSQHPRGHTCTRSQTHMH